MNRNRPGCGPPTGKYRCMRCGSEEGHNAKSCTTNPIPLWWRAILARCAEPGCGGGERRHPAAKVGDSFGPWKVTELLARDFTANERVRVRCPHGFEKDCYVFNLRKAAARAQPCRHASWRQPAHR